MRIKELMKELGKHNPDKKVKVSLEVSKISKANLLCPIVDFATPMGKSDVGAILMIDFDLPTAIFLAIGTEENKKAKRPRKSSSLKSSKRKKAKG